ncbi:MAG: 6-phosphogluconolactonase [Sedimentisphaerales bacterium]|nr:6-phosphogluconolactonase [Sedimentisphaerales bacterium]
MTVKKYEPKIEVLPNSEILAQRCVEIFISDANKAIGTKQSFQAALSGGNSPKRFYELLGIQPQAKALKWSKIHLFWVDERYVPAVSPQSNYKLASDSFLKKVPIPQENIHRIATEYPDINTAARKYEVTLKTVFKLEKGQKPEFDLIILGMGTDGHTGSLFPNSTVSFDTDNLACVVYGIDDKLKRITLTAPVLRQAKHLLVLVQGTEKASILKKVITSEPDEIRYPIQVLWPVLNKVTWLVDKEAAGLL